MLLLGPEGGRIMGEDQTSPASTACPPGMICGISARCVIGSFLLDLALGQTDGQNVLNHISSPPKCMLIRSRFPGTSSQLINSTIRVKRNFRILVLLSLGLLSLNLFLAPNKNLHTY